MSLEETRAAMLNRLNPPPEPEVEAAPDPTDKERRRVTDLARLQVQQQRDVNRLEAALHEAQDRLRRTAEVDLPEAMLAIGQIELTMASGAKIALKTGYHPKQLSDPQGLRYLEGLGGGDLIKHDITMQFGRGHEKLVAQILKRIAQWKSAAQFRLTSKRAVNAQTLGAFVRELVAQERPPDFEALGVHVRHYTEVTLPTNHPGRRDQDG